MSLRIVLADDHQMFRHALRALLAREPDFQVVAEAATGDEVLAIAAAQPVDLVCMDIAFSPCMANLQRRPFCKNATVMMTKPCTAALR